MANADGNIFIVFMEPHSIFPAVKSYHLISLSEAEIGILKRYVGTATLSTGPLHTTWVNTLAHEVLLQNGIIARSEKSTETITTFETTPWGKKVIEGLVRRKLMQVVICPECKTFNGEERETADPDIYDCGCCGHKFNKDINTAGVSR